jgi:uncharacterized OB-fold protein
MEQGFLLPDLGNADAGGFWEGAANGELRIQRCADCGARRMPPRPMCPSCRSLTSRWEPVSGEGRIWSWVVAHPPLLPAYAALAPYPVVTVELAEDPSLRLVGNLVETPDGPINEVDPATIEIGQPVRVVFARVEDMQLPRWVRCQAS